MGGSIDEKVQNDVLPPPVLHTRFLKPNRVRVRWEKLKRRIGNGSAPDESLGDPTTDTSDSESHLARTRTGSRSAMSEKDDGVVDTVVVENEGRYCQWKEGQIKVSTTGASEPHETEGTPATYSGLRSDFASSRNTAFEQAGPLGYVYNYLRWTFYPRLHHFLFLKYHDDALEQAYRRELWWQQKHLHIFGGCFLLLNWILGVSTLPKPWSLFNKVTWYGVIPALAVPLAPMAAFDVPRRKAWVWQAFVCANIVYLSSMNLIEMHLCGYYTPHRNCGAKDFSATLMYAAGTPLLALFAMGMSRLTAIFSLLLWTGLVCGLILPDRSAWSRNLVNTVLLLSFMIWCHYRRDAMDRRVYTLRAELKVQFRAKQKSQINERKAADSKRRLTSYIFHEVRVPLNTALLAVQNLDAADAFKKDSELVVEYAALQGSLQMMSQVLNDVLDFSRMERGGFTSVSRPFSLHGAMKSVFGPLKLDANARALTLKTDLDPRVDEVARKALRDAGASPDDDSSGLVMGDEMRLRQVINNLCSNACKFTPAGGSVTVKTQLVYPSPADLAVEEEIKEVGTGDESNLTPSKLLQHNIDAGSSAEGELIVVRFEVTDTGFGIHPRDMAENRLFSPYIQSELGRRQGGKGTGLGLSLVRNIVMLSGGRLGVRSKLNHGSTFWIEMPFMVGKPVATAIEETDKLQALYSPAAMTVSSLSTKSEMAFMPSLKHSPSDNTLPPALEQAVAAVESAPANFLFSADLSTPSPVSPIDAAQKPPLQPIRTQATPDELARPPPPQPLEHANSAPATVPTVTFPTDVARESLSSRGSTVADKEPLNVLVVDDDLLTRKLMTRMMERLGCRVSTAENGQIALELILADKAVDPKRILYDLICLDNQMPLVSGLQVASRLRGHERDDFIVGVTANAQLAEQEEYIERGANFVLTKPVLEADLKRMIALAEKRRADRRAKAATGKAEDIPTTGDE